MVIRFFDKLFTVLKERTCNWDSIFIVRVYLFLGATIYNLTSLLKYSYWNSNSKKPDKTDKTWNNNLIRFITHVSNNYYSTKSVVVIFKIAVGLGPNYLHIVTTQLVDFVDQLSESR